VGPREARGVGGAVVTALSTPWSIGIVLFLVAFWVLVFALMKTASRADRMSDRWLEQKWLEDGTLEPGQRLVYEAHPIDLYDQDEEHPSRWLGP
jgi:hypothetical protein